MINTISTDTLKTTKKYAKIDWRVSLWRFKNTIAKINQLLFTRPIEFLENFLCDWIFDR